MTDRLDETHKESPSIPDTEAIDEEHLTEHAEDRTDETAVSSTLKHLPQPAPPENLQKSLDLLIREMGRIQQGLARIEGHTALKGEGAAADGDVQWKGFSRMLVEIKERVTREAIISARERRDIRKAVADLQAQVEALQQGRRFAPRSIREIPEPSLRVGLFVDVQNIFYAAKQFNARLDFEKLLKVAVGNRRLIRAIAYVVQSPEVDQSGFISMLGQKGYEIRQKDLRLRSDGSAKGDWDMGMAIDIMELVEKLDVIVLVTGDGDFVSLVNLIKTIGPRVEVISFLHNTARDLIQSVDLHTQIEEALLMRSPGNGANHQSGATATSDAEAGNREEAQRS